MFPTKAAAFTLLAILAVGCSAAEPETSTDVDAVVLGDLEQRTADRLEAIKDDPAALADFVRRIPKGGDLHHHLSGAVYAETYLEWAAEEGGYCVGPSQTLTTSCAGGTMSVPEPDAPLYSQLVDAWSMEGFVPTAGATGHDHFFSTFGKIAAMSGTAHHGKSLADVMKRADDENEQYIELMLFSNSVARAAGETVWSRAHGTAAMKATDFAAFQAELLAASEMTSASGGIQAIITDVTASESQARAILACDTPKPSGPCAVATRYEVYISRSGAAPSVFAQMVAAFEAAKRDGRVVALNLVGPEDGSPALKAYDLQMAMLDYLHGVYEGVSPLRITLHAGELTARRLPSGSTPESLDHIRKAVEIAHAQRIGHGVDVMQENDPQALLAELAAKHVLVEICLTSNSQILEVDGAAHPLAAYLAAGVPVALATDDQGISRTSIAKEFERAVRVHGLGYRQLKALAKNSIDYSFIPGGDLAASQAELARRFRAFESTP